MTYFMISFYIIAGSKPVTAFKDVWVIRDCFVNETYHALPALHIKTKDEKSVGLYLYEQYNMKCFTSKPTSNTTSVPAQLVNCVIKATNELEKLPRIILLILDWDILRYFEHTSFGVMEITKKVVKWMVNTIKKAIEAKRDRLQKLHLGAMVANEPKIIWVKMINRLAAYDKVLTVRRKFNMALENVLAKCSNQYLKDLHPAMNNANLFTAPNYLNGDGCAVYWQELND